MVKQDYSEQYLLWFRYASLPDMKAPTSWPVQKKKESNVITRTRLHTTDQEN
jgi:hypothetical protein